MIDDAMQTVTQAPPPPAGFVPAQSDAPPPPPGFVPAAAPVTAAPSKPQPAQDAVNGDLTANTNQEGLYPMKTPQGQTIQVPYSNVHRALDAGHLFTDKNTLQQYARDHAADPLSEDRVDQWLDKHPYLGNVAGGQVFQVLKGAGTGVLKLATGLDRTPTTRAETDLQLAAATPTKGNTEQLGETGENVGEFFSGEELMGMLGKVGSGLNLGEKLKTVTGLAQTIEKYPMIGKLLKIGASAVKQGTVAGGQTFVKSGGDPEAAATTAGATALGGVALSGAGAVGAAANAMREGAPAAAAPGIVERTVGGVKIPVPEAAIAPATPTAQASAQAYGAMAREAIKPHLEALNSAPKLIEDTLATTHDLTGAADRLQKNVLNPLYETLNTATGGRFRTLNSEVQAAQKAARMGDPESAGAYKNKIAEMDGLLDKETGGAVPKDYLQKIKAAWTTSYALEDLGDMWDRNINGAPGASKVSQEQRGLNGNGLMTDIQRAVKVYGRDRLETALGPGRLENFENIARWNQTNAKRKAFNIAVQEVASNLPKEKPEGVPDFVKGHAAGLAAGTAMHFAGGPWYLGVLGGEAGYYGTKKVMNAIATNPRIGQNFLFALESGATAKKYGSFLATMIQQQETESARERAATEAQKQQ